MLYLDAKKLSEPKASFNGILTYACKMLMQSDKDRT